MSLKRRFSAAMIDLCFIDAQGRLRDIGNRGVWSKVEVFHVGFRLDKMDPGRNTSHRAFDFRMAGVADQYDGAALLHIALALAMNFRHQGTGRVEDRQSERGGFVPRRSGQRHGH